MEMTAWITATAITVSTVIALANLLMMGVLTQAIHQHSIRTSAVETMRQNSSQWRELNLAAMQNPRLQALLDGEEPQSSDEQHIRRNILFYILNGLHDVFLASLGGIVPRDEAVRLIRQQMSVLSPHGDHIEALLALERGYDDGFATVVRAELRALHRANGNPI